MQPGIGLVGRAGQPGHDATDGAHQVAVLRQGDFRRHGARAAAVAMGLGAGCQRQRNRRSIRPLQRFVAAGGALRPARHPMAGARERADVHRERLFVNRGRLIEHQPLDDLRRDQPVERFEDGRLRRKRLERGLLAGNAAQEVVDFLMAAQAVGQAVPAGSLSVRAKDGAEQRLDAVRPHQRPRRARLELATIHLREPCFEIVFADDDREPGRCSSHPGAGRFQAPCQPTVVALDRDARFRKPSLDPARRRAERRPVGRPARVQAVIGRDHIAPGGQRRDGGKHIGGGMGALQRRHDLVAGTPAVDQRQQLAVQPAVQQRIERLRHQQRLLLADVAELQVGGQRGKRDEAPVLGRRSRQNPAAGVRILPGLHLGLPCRLSRHLPGLRRDAPGLRRKTRRSRIRSHAQSGPRRPTSAIGRRTRGAPASYRRRVASS